MLANRPAEVGDVAVPPVGRAGQETAASEPGGAEPTPTVLLENSCPTPVGDRLDLLAIVPQASWFRVYHGESRVGFGKLMISHQGGGVEIAWELCRDASQERWLALVDPSGRIASCSYTTESGMVTTTSVVTRQGNTLVGTVTCGADVLRPILQPAEERSIPVTFFAAALAVPLGTEKAREEFFMPIFAEDSDGAPCGCVSLRRTGEAQFPSSEEGGPYYGVSRTRRGSVDQLAWIDVEGNLVRLESELLGTWVRESYPTEFLCLRAKSAPESSSWSEDRVVYSFQLAQDSARVMECWLDPARVKTWWLGEAEIDARPGGRYAILDPQTGFTLAGTIRELAVDRLTITWEGKSEWRPCDEVRVTVTNLAHGGCQMQIEGVLSKSRQFRSGQSGDNIDFWRFFGARCAAAAESSGK